jgi:hypothetical protein
VRVLLKRGWEQTFPNAVYQLVGQEREEIAQFDLETVRCYEYFIEE